MDLRQNTSRGDKEVPRFWFGEKLPDNYTSRPTENHEIIIRIHHGGEFFADPAPEYKRGQLYVMKDGWDVDEISTIELGKCLKTLGYPTYKCLWYRHPERDLSNGLRELNTDKDVIQFIHDVRGHSTVDLYVEHLIDIPVVTEKSSSSEVLEVPVGGVEYGETESDSDDPEYRDSGSNKSEGEGDVCTSGDDISLDDSDYDEEWDWTSVLPEETINPSGPQTARSSKVEVALETIPGPTGATTASRNTDPTTFADFEDEDGDSDDLDTPPSSEAEEGGKKKFPKFKLSENEVEVKFEIGQIFSSAELVRTAVKEYALQAKKNVYFVKNDRKRIVVKCMQGCPFYLRVSKSTHETYYQIVSLDASHTCHRTAKNRQAKTRWIAKKFMSTLRHTPNMKVKGLQEEARNRWGVLLSKYQCYRAQKKALEMIQGCISDQYKHLRSYGEELLRSNPDSTVVIKSTLGLNGPVFVRMYVCFNACKTAFVTTCRPLIGLDGCFLKGQYGGQLLTAVGKDGNNQMIPIAFAIVEAETKDSWTWFLNLLMDDLNKIEHKRWAFISDQQKGLVPTLQSMDENVEHRLCVKHLYGNWRKKYPGDMMKEALWAAARASTMPEFSRAMENIKKLSENAWRDMCEVPPSMWTRAAYSTHTCCDLQVNNMCEAFNKAILEYRDKPIISLVEGLKFYMTDRIVKQRDKMLRYTGKICPMVQQKLEKIKKEADGWSPYWCGDINYALFEVSNNIDKYVVNLTEKQCSCKRWDLSGIPCCHAVACMWFNNHIPEDYVNPYYSKSTFLATYDHLILPCNGPKLWPVIDAEPINPPYMRRAPGRPKKQRRKANDEPRNPHRLRKDQTTVRCRRCGILGHNKRTCKGKAAADRVIPKGGNKTHTQVQQPEERASQAHSEVHQASQASVQGGGGTSQVEVQGGGRTSQAQVQGRGSTSGQFSGVQRQGGSKRKTRETLGTQESQKNSN